MQHITMVANNNLNNGLTHAEVIDLLVIGFKGKLLSWWDKYLTGVSREQIRSVIKKRR